MFTAKDARRVVGISKNNNLNYQRNRILDKIKNAAANGDTFIVLDDSRIMLFDDDIKFFEGLGYKVTPGTVDVKNNMQWVTFGVISWAENGG